MVNIYPMGGNSDIVPQGFQEVVKSEVITDRLSFSVALISFRLSIGSPEDGFRMDPDPSESDPIKFVFPLYLFSKVSSCFT